MILSGVDAEKMIARQKCCREVLMMIFDCRR